MLRFCFAGDCREVSFDLVFQERNVKSSSFPYERPVQAVLLLIIFVFVLATCLLALAPPIARDALIHHLAIPKLWLIHGGFYETPWAVYSYYPMNLDLLYLIPLAFGNDVIPHFIHMAFALGTAFLIYLYLNRRSGRTAGLLGAAIYISTPVIVKLSTMAYVDLGLTFFTTASVLAVAVWRDSRYENHGWLFVSAVAMGLALGVKYNALLAWFFLTMAIVFLHARDTGKQGKSLQRGVFFFLISLALFSPWLIKNAALTGNPFYPLFKGIFGAYETVGQRAYSLVSGQAYMGMFKTREILYDESIWEVLLIPIRFFLEGQDHTPRYFDGVLNPILILAAPFAFIKRKYTADKLLFLGFAGFVVLLAFFLDQHRIRYILPAVPFAVILTVMGLENLCRVVSDKMPRFRAAGPVVILPALIFLFVFNAAYLKNYFQSIAPVNYLLKKESRDQFVARHDGSYPAIKYINENTAENAKIRLILLAGRGYYLNRYYEDNASFGLDIVQNLVKTSSDADAFAAYLRSLNCTHLLARYDLLLQHLTQYYPPERIRHLNECLEKNAEILFQDGHYAVFRLIP